MRKRLPCDQIQAGLLRLLLKSSKVYSVLSDRTGHFRHMGKTRKRHGAQMCLIWCREHLKRLHEHIGVINRCILHNNYFTQVHANLLIHNKTTSEGYVNNYHLQMSNHPPYVPKYEHFLDLVLNVLVSWCMQCNAHNKSRVHSSPPTHTESCRRLQTYTMIQSIPLSLSHKVFHNFFLS